MTQQEQAVRRPGVLDIVQLDTDQLMRQWQKASDEVAAYQETVDRIEMELGRRMRMDGATETPHPHYTIKIQPPYKEWDLSHLFTASELIPIDRWRDLYTPPTTRPVPPKINMTKLKACRSLNRRIGEIIDEAEKPSGPGKLRIRPKYSDQDGS